MTPEHAKIVDELRDIFDVNKADVTRTSVRIRDTVFSSHTTFDVIKNIVEDAAPKSEKAAKLLLGVFTSKTPTVIARNDNDAEKDHLHPTFPLDGTPDTNECYRAIGEAPLPGQSLYDPHSFFVPKDGRRVPADLICIATKLSVGCESDRGLSVAARFLHECTHKMHHDDNPAAFERRSIETPHPSAGFPNKEEQLSVLEETGILEELGERPRQEYLCSNGQGLYAFSDLRGSIDATLLRKNEAIIKRSEGEKDAVVRELFSFYENSVPGKRYKKAYPDEEIRSLTLMSRNDVRSCVITRNNDDEAPVKGSGVLYDCVESDTPIARLLAKRLMLNVKSDEIRLKAKPPAEQLQPKSKSDDVSYGSITDLQSGSKRAVLLPDLLSLQTPIPPTMGPTSTPMISSREYGALSSFPNFYSACTCDGSRRNRTLP